MLEKQKLIHFNCKCLQYCHHYLPISHKDFHTILSFSLCLPRLSFSYVLSFSSWFQFILYAFISLPQLSICSYRYWWDESRRDVCRILLVLHCYQCSYYFNEDFSLNQALYTLLWCMIGLRLFQSWQLACMTVDQLYFTTHTFTNHAWFTVYTFDVNITLCIYTFPLNQLQVQSHLFALRNRYILSTFLWCSTVTP